MVLACECVYSIMLSILISYSYLERSKPEPCYSLHTASTQVSSVAFPQSCATESGISPLVSNAHVVDSMPNQ